MVFDTPKPIRGTALLAYSHLQGPDDQWLYLPAQRRVKKIASRNKSGPFLSSEFAYEDLALQDVDKFTYRMLAKSPAATRVPQDRAGAAGRIFRLLAGRGAARRAPPFGWNSVDYYDRHGRPLKRLTEEGYELYEDRYWKPRRMFMENLQTGKTTELLWNEYRFDNGLLADRDFSTNALKRVR